MSDIWKPSVTVAAIIERQGKFLLVEEETSDGVRFNQPAGHLDPGESLIAAASREALEETAHEFTPDALIGVYMSRYISSRTNENVTYLRFAFFEHFHHLMLQFGILGVRLLQLCLGFLHLPVLVNHQLFELLVLTK